MPTGDCDKMWASIWETVMPDSSTARRCLCSVSFGTRRIPTTAPSASASSATPAVSSSADSTLTSKWYETGERHPSSVRPKRDMSHTLAQVFGSRSPSVCPEKPFGALFGPLARHGGGAGGGRLRIQVRATDDGRPQVAGEVVAQRDAGRDVQAHDVLVRHLVEVF